MNPQDVSRDLFERRMRQRRAATCVSAARASLAEGRTLEAAERLEEACRLDPEALEARLLLEEIRAEGPAELSGLVNEEPVPSTAGFGKWSHWVAAVIAVAALAALALLKQPGADESSNEPARDRARPPVETGAPAAAEATPDTLPRPARPGDSVPLVIRPAGSPPTVASSEPQDPAAGSGGAIGTGGRRDTREERGTETSPPGKSSRGAGSARSTAATDPPGAGAAPSRPITERAAGATGGVEPPAERPAAAGTAGEARGGETKLPATEATRGLEAAPQPAASAVPPPAQVQSSAAAQAAARTAGPPLQSVPASNAAVQPVDDAAARRAATPPVVDDAAGRRPAAPANRTDPAPASYRAPRDEEEIGRTLQQYADAYERLDAAAARRVWPSVDERALARAFAGLESQGISFEHCDTEVEGAEARAVCRGRAEYVPKVGSRDPLTASRQWTFRLRRAGEGWQIASAVVR